MIHDLVDHDSELTDLNYLGFGDDFSLEDFPC
jgi:hypothetical protein